MHTRNTITISASLLQIIRVGIYIILFLPLFVNEHFLFPFIFPRTVAFRIIVEICFLLYLMLSLLDERYRPRRSVLLLLLSGFIGWMTLTALTGVNAYHSLWSSVERSEGVITWLHLLAFFVILVGVLKNWEDWRSVLRIVIIAGCFQTLYGLGQFFNLSFALSSGERLSGSLGNASFLSTYLIFIIFIAGYLLSRESNKIIRLLYGVLIGLDVFLLLQTQTRGAMLGLLLGALFWLGVTLWRSKKPLAKICFVSLVGLLISFGTILIINKEAPWVYAITPLRRLATISPADITAQNRLIVWGSGWQSFIERPLLGWGWENFDTAFNHNFNPAITRDVGSRPWYDRAHNVVVEVAVATGIIGLLLYLAIIGWTITLLWSRQQSQNKSSTMNVILVGLLLAYLLQNMFVFDTVNSYVLFFLLLAFIQSQQPTVDKKPAFTFTAGQVVAAGAVLVSIILPVLYAVNIRPALASFYIIKAVGNDRNDPQAMLEDFKQSFIFSPPNDREMRFILIQQARDKINTIGITDQTLPLIEYTIDEMNTSIAASPDAIQNYLLLGELYLALSPLNLDYLRRAEEITLAALDRAPRRYQTYTLLGRIKMSQAQVEQGIAYFKQAISLNDQFAEAHWNLAIAYILSWQPELARQSIDRALAEGFDVYSANNVTRLLLAFRDSKDLKSTISFLESLVARFPENQEYRESLQSLQQIYQQSLEAVNEMPETN